MWMDAGNFYLNTPLEDYQYMRFPVWMIPDEIMKEYGYVKKALLQFQHAIPKQPHLLKRSVD